MAQLQQWKTDSCVAQPWCSLLCVMVSYLLLAFLDPFLFSRETCLQNQQTTLLRITAQQGFTTATATCHPYGLTRKQHLSSALEYTTSSQKQKYLSKAPTFASFVVKPLHVACKTAGVGAQSGGTSLISISAPKCTQSFFLVNDFYQTSFQFVVWQKHKEWKYIFLVKKEN